MTDEISVSQDVLPFCQIIYNSNLKSFTFTNARNNNNSSAPIFIPGSFLLQVLKKKFTVAAVVYLNSLSSFHATFINSGSSGL